MTTGDSSNIIEHVVTPEEVGERLDRVVASLTGIVSRAYAARLADAGAIMVDGVARSKNYALREGSTLAIDLPPVESSTLKAENISLDVRYEDEWLIVLSKAEGMVVHPARGHHSGTLVNALLGRDADFGSGSASFRPGIVHRLDKDTSGLMVVAKNETTRAALSAALKARSVERRYVALVHGIVSPDTGLIDAPLGRHPKDRLKMAISDAAGSRVASTSFTVLERFSPQLGDDGFTLLECRLHTGRTHQIRVHMAYIKHPVVGDPVYGRRATGGNLGLHRQFLHAWYLTFTHPVTGKLVEIADTLPKDLLGARTLLTGRVAECTSAGRETLEAVGWVPLSQTGGRESSQQ